MTRRQYTGGAARTTITGSIPSTGGGTVIIATSTGWPDGTIGKFQITVDPGLSSEEKILIDTRSGTTLTFSAGGRGADGSTATSHSAGATIWHSFWALDADEANAHINALIAAHAASAISFAPGGTVSGTNLQTAVAEVASEIDARVIPIEANNWVTLARMADASVGTAELIDGTVTTAKLAAGAVNEAALGSALVTWTAQIDQGATTNIAKTVNEADYCRIGNQVWFWFDLTLTGTGTGGALVKVTLPVAPAATHATHAHFGVGMYYQLSPAGRYQGALERDDTPTKVVFSVGAGPPNDRVGIAPNIALAVGDTLRGSGTYRV